MNNNLKNAILFSIALLLGPLAFAGGESSGGGFSNQNVWQPYTGNDDQKVDDSYESKTEMKYVMIQDYRILESVFVPEFLFKWMQSSISIIELNTEGKRYYLGLVERSESEILVQSMTGSQLYFEIADYEEQITCEFDFVTTYYLKVNCR